MRGSDPQGTRTDAEIISALKRAWLLPREKTSADPMAEAKFSLDSAVSDEGSNYSAGEKQLLALCRALVKNSRIIVLVRVCSLMWRHLLNVSCRMRQRVTWMLRRMRRFKRRSKQNSHLLLCCVSPTGSTPSVRRFRPVQS